MPRPISDAKRNEATRRLTMAMNNRTRAAHQAELARQKFFRYCLKAYNAGLSYAEIKEVTGLTEIRISQILRKEREIANGD